MTKKKATKGGCTPKRDESAMESELSVDWWLSFIERNAENKSNFKKSMEIYNSKLKQVLK